MDSSSQQEHQDKQIVQLSFYARDLKKKKRQGLFFNYNICPYLLIVQLAKTPDEDHVILGRTEILDNCTNPFWIKTFNLNYQFGEPTYINVGIYDAGPGRSNNSTVGSTTTSSSSIKDGVNINTSRNNSERPLGSCMFDVGSIIGSRNNIKAKQIRNNCGILFARIERIQHHYHDYHHNLQNNIISTTSSNNDEQISSSHSSSFQRQQQLIQLKFGCINLKNIERIFEGGTSIFGGKSDPFFEIWKQFYSTNGTIWICIYRSNYIENNLNPIWETFKIPLHKLYHNDSTTNASSNNINHDKNQATTTIEPTGITTTITLVDKIKDTTLKIHIYDYNSNGKHKSMGMVLLKVQQLLDASSITTSVVGNEYKLHPCENNNKSSSSSKKNLGTLKIFEANVICSDNENSNSTTSTTTTTPINSPTVSNSKATARNVIKSPELSSPRGIHQMNKISSSPTNNNKKHHHRFLPRPKKVHSSNTSSNDVVTSSSSRNNNSNSDSGGSGAAPTKDYPSSSPSRSTASASSTLSSPTSTLPINNTTTTGTEQQQRQQQQRPLFVDYITGGCELKLCVAIDFTGSNGDPRQPNSLHYIHPPDSNKYNEYEKAIISIGSVIANFQCSNQKFPLYGFGAKPNRYSSVNHCFTLSPKGEHVDGIDGIMEAYRNMFQHDICMSGPTVFKDVINCARARAKESYNEAKRVGRQAYTILMIVTDGSVNDMIETKSTLLDASTSPLSVVVVGVGGNNADFTKIKSLKQQLIDATTTITQQGQGVVGVRDIFQFVEFRNCPNLIDLTSSTLEEIPIQLVDYFYNREIMPLPLPPPPPISPPPSLSSKEEIKDGEANTNGPDLHYYQRSRRNIENDNNDDVEEADYSAAEEYNELVDVDLNLQFDDKNEEMTVIHDDVSYCHINHMFHPPQSHSSLQTSQLQIQQPPSPSQAQQQQQPQVVTSSPLQQQHQTYHHNRLAPPSHSQRCSAPSTSSSSLMMGATTTPPRSHIRHVSLPLHESSYSSSTNDRINYSPGRSPIVTSRPLVSSTSSNYPASPEPYSSTTVERSPFVASHSGHGIYHSTGSKNDLTSSPRFSSPFSFKETVCASTPSSPFAFGATANYTNSTSSTSFHSPPPPPRQSYTTSSTNHANSSNPSSSPYHPPSPRQVSTSSPKNSFRVKVSNGILPGSSVEVQSPLTKQKFIVTVPEGAVTGSTFIVSSDGQSYLDVNK